MPRGAADAPVLTRDPAGRPPSAAVPPPAWSTGRWSAAIAGVLAEPDRLQLAYQPIVSLPQARIVGYEALARFPADPGPTPDRWFAAADALGCGAELEAVVLAHALRARDGLPPDCFLTVNVSPHLLTRAPVADLLLAAGDLAPLVLELTEHQAVHDLPPLLALRAELVARGALIALDDAGSGYSGLQQMAQLRPHLVKLDRGLVADADRDEIKLALAELLGEFAGRMDAWLLAEGIETWGELEALLRLGVPLGQGYLLGRPAPPWSELDPGTAQLLRSRAATSRLVENVASLVEQVPADTAPRHDQIGLTTDVYGRPQALLLPRHGDGPGHRRVAVTLKVAPSAGVIEVARRLVARAESHRFDPVVCVDGTGRAVGVIRVERLLLRLAGLKDASGRDDD